MSNERLPLPAALGQIADGAAAAHAARDLAGAGLPLARMHTAARRRRVAFGTGVGVAAAAVVGVLVLGAAAAGGLIDRDPVPPVETPDETADPVAWAVDYSRCGQAPDDWLGQDQAKGIQMLFFTPPGIDDSAMFSIATVIADDGVDVDALQRASTRHEIVAFDATGIVGVAGRPVDAPPDEMVPPSAQQLPEPLPQEAVAVSTTAPLFSCASQDGRSRLEPGTYGVQVGQRVEMLLDGTTQERRMALTVPRVTVPEPAVDAPEALPAALLDGQVPWCDETFDVATTGDPQLSIALDQRLDDASGEVDTTITMTNDLGAGPVQMPVGFLRLVLTRDGIAVGFGDVGGDSGGTIDPGTTRVLDDVYVSAECPGSKADPETGLPPGVYELWAVVPLGEDELHVGGVVDEPPMLVAGPWPFLLGAPDAVAGPDPSTTAITELPGCGESTEDLYVTSGRVNGDATVKVGLLADVTAGEFLHEGYGDTLSVDATLRNDGPNLYQTRQSVTEIVIAEDGVVVVTGQLDSGAPSADAWPGGESRESSGYITTTRCADADPDILRHGQYTLWARTTVEWATEPDGEAQTRSVIDWPVDFWVYDFEDPDNQGPVTWTSAGPTS